MAVMAKKMAGNAKIFNNDERRESLALSRRSGAK